MIEESEAVIDNWADTLSWYMTEYSHLGYEKIANIFIKSFTLIAKTLAKDLQEMTLDDIKKKYIRNLLIKISIHYLLRHKQ